MKHFIALDVSKGKSSMVIYDGYRKCEFEGELNHTRVDFGRLHERLEEITKLDGQAPQIVFEATLRVRENMHLVMMLVTMWRFYVRRMNHFKLL